MVTDSTSDLPTELARALEITVVPLTVSLKKESYLDGIDLTADQFYDKLRQSDVLPTTSQPSPADFIGVYQDLQAKGEGIVSIHISQKLSGTYNSALLGRTAVQKTSRIEVIDSLSCSMGLGLVVIQAARLAKSGASIDQVVEATNKAIDRAHFFGTVDTLEYMHKGGRIGKAQALLGTLLSIKPILCVRDGEAHPYGKERTRKKAINRVFEIVQGYKAIRDITVLHSTAPDEAAALTERLVPVVGRDKIIQSRIGPVIGSYLGPGTIAVGILEGAD
ncbi:MAG: DegV family protein [Dehalococcoidia bacterium]|nr:DegV family protein [Dehalococcoidia bacterium]